MIERGMILAAGFGKRMRPLTETTPKPLIPVCGKPMLDWALERLAAEGVARVVVNAHHLAARIEAHLAGRAGVAVSVEPEILETGGGVKRALPLLTEGAPDAPFFVINGDAVWLDGARPALARLAAAWDADAMDALLLLQPTAEADGYDGRGDYHRAADGRARRRAPEETAPYLFAGIQILHPRLFSNAPEGPFSLNRLYDAAEAAGRLAALVHDGRWFHVGTPEALVAAEAEIRRVGNGP